LVIVLKRIYNRVFPFLWGVSPLDDFSPPKNHWYYSWKTNQIMWLGTSCALFYFSMFFPSSFNGMDAFCIVSHHHVHHVHIRFVLFVCLRWCFLVRGKKNLSWKHDSVFLSTWIKENCHESTKETAPMNPSLTKSAFASSKGDLGVVSFLLLSLVFFVQGEFSFLQNLLCFCLNVFKGISRGSLCHWLK
jgi:hypothetical protein